MAEDPQKNINKVAKQIDKGVDTFLEGVQKSEVGIFNNVLATVKNLETDAAGNIKQTVKNLRILKDVRKVIQDEIITDAYIKRVNSLANEYPAIASLNNEYFSSIVEAFKPNRELYKEVISSSIDLTKASLLDAGINQNVIGPVTKIVEDSTTTGASFANMVEELRTIIKGDAERLGLLSRYSSQVTQDALNQFNGTYNNTIANDLGLEWFYYSGGVGTTSRPFCRKYHNRYYHKKEVEDFGKRKDLDGSNLCGGPTKTNLCTGRIKSTNSSNIFIYRGGYNCRHIYKPTLIDAVPKSVIERNIEKGYYKLTDDDIIKKPVPKKQPVKKPTKKVEPKKPITKEPQPIKTHDEFLARTDKYLNKNIDRKTQFWLDHTKQVTNDNFKGAPIKSLNSIANAFDDLFPKFDIKLNSMGHSGRGKSLGLYFSQVDALALQKTYLKSANKISEQTRKAYLLSKDKNIARVKNIISSDRPKQVVSRAQGRLERLKSTDKWSVSSVSSDPVYTTTIHEGYHAVDKKFNLTTSVIRGSSQTGKKSIFRDFLDKNNVVDTDILKVSEYAFTNESELFAEVGAALNDKLSIPKNIEKAFKETINSISK